MLKSCRYVISLKGKGDHMKNEDKPVADAVKRQTLGFGVKTLRANHRMIRDLKRLHSPSYHGFRQWPSSWLLMDFIKFKGLAEGSRVLDAGCGWGLTGIYCAKNHGSVVTGFDIDSEVFPYLHMHADINGVNITTLNQGFDEFTNDQLKNFDLLIGTDICFWDSMVGSLKALILRALISGVRKVLIADPGRSPFEELGRYFMEKGNGEVRDWTACHPYPIQGRILSISAV
jgi:predicted nicotinamide N-methyase